jgi:acyl carrier protein
VIADRPIGPTPDAEKENMSTPESAPTEPLTVDTLRDWLVDRVAGYREVPAAEIDPTVPLAELGLDSVYALSLCGEIEDSWGLETEPTVAWDHPTIDALAGHLHGELAGGGAGRPGPR